MFAGYLSILLKRPVGPMKPISFIKGSHALLQTVLHRVRRRWNRFPRVMEEWDEFEARAPRSDSVSEYLQSMPLVLPMQGYLFQDVPSAPSSPDVFTRPQTMPVADRLDEPTVIHTGMIDANGRIHQWPQAASQRVSRGGRALPGRGALPRGGAQWGRWSSYIV